VSRPKKKYPFWKKREQASPPASSPRLCRTSIRHRWEELARRPVLHRRWEELAQLLAGHLWSLRRRIGAGTPASERRRPRPPPPLLPGDRWLAPPPPLPFSSVAGAAPPYLLLLRGRRRPPYLLLLARIGAKLRSSPVSKQGRRNSPASEGTPGQLLPLAPSLLPSSAPPFLSGRRRRAAPTRAQTPPPPFPWQPVRSAELQKGIRARLVR
jgi:hypothetical protein